MWPALDENLAAHRFGRLNALAKTRRIDRRIPPAKKNLSFSSDHFLDNGFDDLAAFRIARQKKRADRIVARRRQDKAELACPFGKKAVRNLNQHATAIARPGIGADRTAMIEIAQNLEAHADDFMRFAIVHVGNETDAAGIMFVGWRIKALRDRQAGIDVDWAGQDRIGHPSTFHKMVPPPGRSRTPIQRA